MVFVSVSETYDLSTKQGRMSLIGIHTPTKEIIQKTYPGLCMNSKFVRIVKQDVALACASAMPFSAEIIGTGADDIAPEDAFNPILFKAVSNESMSTVEARLWGLNYQSSQTNMLPTFHGSQVVAENENVAGMPENIDDFGVYYSLLSNHSGFKTANPQQGLVMKNLVPLVFEKYYNGGVNSIGDNQPAIIEEVGDPDDVVLRAQTPVSSMRGKAHPMPRFNTTYVTGLGNTVASGGMPNGMGDGTPQSGQAQMPNLMPVYTACIIMPPSRLHSLFYRLVVRTTLEFTEVRPIQEVASFASMNSDYAPVVYHSDYTYQSAKMTSTAGMVDAKDAEITKIMEGA